MRHHPLPAEYLKALDSKDSFRLTIMGKDPYPNDAVGIPFCKPCWDRMCDKRISGLFVLQSMGVNIENARNEFFSPADYFIYLAKEKGIVFLNLSYHYLGGSVRKNHNLQLQMAEQVNKKYLLKSQVIVLCGEARQIRWYQGDYSSLNIFYAVHPDNRNRFKDSWAQWWSRGSLEKRFKI